MRLLGRCICAALLTGGAASAGAANSITRATVGAGAGAAAGGTAAVRATLGQPLVSPTRAATAGIAAGFWLLPPGRVTGAPEGPPVPLEFRVYPNHPNPFNPRTTLAFDLPADAARVRLRLYDVHGRLVATLVNAPLAAGRHSVTWTGADDRGHPVASGVYVSVLETPLGRALGKLTLVR